MSRVKSEYPSADRTFSPCARASDHFIFCSTAMRNPPPLLLLVASLALASYLGADAFGSGHIRTKGAAASSSSSSHDASPSTSAATTSSSASIEPPHLDVMEERERREMSWLVKSTSRLLGDPSTSASSSTTASAKRGHRRRNQLTPTDMRQLAPVMRAWARRASRSRRSSSSARRSSSTTPRTEEQHGPGADSPHVVERLLARIQREQSEGNPAAQVTTQHYNLLIEAWCRRGGRDAINQAERILQNGQMVPSSRSINMIIKAWVKVAGDGQGNTAADEALEHVDSMLQRAEELQLANLRGYNLYLSALYLPRRKDGRAAATAAAELAEKTLDRMRQHGVPPDANSYLQCIIAWSKVGDKSSADRAQKLFQQIKDSGLTPNTDCYNALLNCWNRSGKSLSSALQNVRLILEEMDERYQSTNDEDAKPNQTTINTALTVLSKDKTLRSMKYAAELFARAEEVYGIELDTLSYNLMIKFYSELGELGDVTKPIELLDTMEKQFRATTFGAGQAGPTCMPDAFTYVSVINSITCNSRGPGRGKKAEDILRRMDTLHRNALGAKPCAEVFNSVINAWAVSRDRHAVHKAEKLLREMEVRAEAGEEALRPTRKTYNTMLKVYASQGQGEQAEALLDRIEDVADSYSFCTCINAYAKSESDDKAKRGVEILNRMENAYKNGKKSAKPNVQAFNSCLNCCAYTTATEEKIEAFLIAVSAFLMLEKYAEPDHVTFATFLKAVSKLIPRGEERRRQVVDVVFNRCCRDGLVSPFVLQQLSFAASANQYQMLLQDHIEIPGKRVSIRDIPTEWTRKVGRTR